MKPIGNSLIALFIVVLALTANTALAAVTASVDRNRVALGDTLRLTITATDDEEIDEARLGALQQDFDIIQRSTSSNTSIINGSFSHTRKLIVDLAPRREGTLQIPAMTFGQSSTPAMSIAVLPPSDTPGAGQSVVFEASVDSDTVYVQGQVILTLRVQQAVNLEGRSLTPLKLENAFVKPLEQRSFQRVIDGRPWLVDEVRYAIFPEQSGTLEIPTLVFSGRIDHGRRSFFDLGGGGQPVRRTSAPISIEVLPKPANYPAADWLPAKQLTLEETWSTPPEQLRVGESATRTIRIVGEGLQGAQLPPILFTPPDGLKYYPDQPSISEQEVADGLEGIREDSAAVVPTRAGTYVIPEIRIPWWDTDTGELQFAVLPEQTITATGSLPAATANPAAPVDETAAQGSIPSPSSAIDLGATPHPDGAGATQQALLGWQIVAVVSTLGWLLTLVYLWRKRPSKTAETVANTENVSEKKAFKDLLKACERGSPASARAAMITWAAALHPETAVVSLEQAAQMLGDEDIRQQLEALDAALYRPQGSNWNGNVLAACVRRVRNSSKRKSGGEPEVQLYPAAQ
jgi:oxygen tolerance protein BatD